MADLLSSNSREMGWSAAGRPVTYARRAADVSSMMSVVVSGMVFMMHSMMAAKLEQYDASSCTSRR